MSSASSRSISPPPFPLPRPHGHSLLWRYHSSTPFRVMSSPPTPLPAFTFIPLFPVRMSTTSPSPPPRSPKFLSTALATTAAALLLHINPVSPPLTYPSPTPLPSISSPSQSSNRRNHLSSPSLSPTAEAQILLRMCVAVTCGAIIGTERRAASANAGVRTFSLVSLGAAIFSLTSLHGLGGDPTRMAAAISTGIGFLGSGAINGDISGSQRQLVTAASIWIAAALGVAAACGMHGMALLGAVITVWILRWQLLRRYMRLFFWRRVGRLVTGVTGRWRKREEHENSAVEERERAKTKGG